MKMINKRGPRIDPWGTTNLIDNLLDRELSTRVILDKSSKILNQNNS